MSDLGTDPSCNQISIILFAFGGFVLGGLTTLLMIMLEEMKTKKRSENIEKEIKEEKKKAYARYMRQQFPQEFAHFDLKNFTRYGTVPEDFCPEFELIDQEEK
jgi:hypothetical protein